MSICNNIERIKNNIEKIRQEKGIDQEITLIAVSKTVEPEKVKEAYDCGQINFGENKVQELIRKKDNLKDLNNLNFHMIGYLQSNKVKYLIDNVKLIHSLDRKSLLKELEKKGKSQNYIFNCLIQVNLAKEESKSGIYIEDLDSFLDLIEECNFVKVKGLMMIAPYFDDPNDARDLFKGMKNLFEELKKRKFKNIKMQYLSMGMSHDYEIAIEEGANIVRIGTSIFGKRVYN